ncbi:hypothetical protein HPB48_012815 [Haemaphysalis longicornis]|uniref:Uncharacterized protein n=1 Tax=Haemaphysalis longicornis TaxID=44386 RepID=A0A9J6FA59_HAELO|nr:hypothetical protein HPB48_012815 [Haemaphysalis longicornis]
MQTYLKDLKLRHSRLSRLYSTTANVHKARQSPSANPEVLRYERNKAAESRSKQVKTKQISHQGTSKVHFLLSGNDL